MRPAPDGTAPRYSRRGSRHRHPPDGAFSRARPAAPTGEPRDGVPQPGGWRRRACWGSGSRRRGCASIQRRAPRPLHLRGLWADPRPPMSRWGSARPGGALPRRARPHGRAHGPRDPRPECRALWPLPGLSPSRGLGALPGTWGESRRLEAVGFSRGPTSDRGSAVRVTDGGSALSLES